jgi:Leucine-rich repeat (LRR) protein
VTLKRGFFSKAAWLRHCHSLKKRCHMFLRIVATLSTLIIAGGCLRKVDHADPRDDDNNGEIEAVATLRELGACNIEIDNALPGRPAVGVCFDQINLSDKELASLKYLKKLRWLSFGSCVVRDENLAVLRELSSLLSLDFSESRGLSDMGLAHVKDLRQLQELSLFGTGISDVGMVHLENLHDLRDLNLAGTKISDRGLAHIKDLNQLRRLSLCDAALVTDTGLVHLSGLKNLNRLNLGNIHVSDKGLASLKGFLRLQDLCLSGTDVTDIGLIHLKDIPNLRRVRLDSTSVTEIGLAYLKDLKQLTTVELAEWQITNAVRKVMADNGQLHILARAHLKPAIWPVDIGPER